MNDGGGKTRLPPLRGYSEPEEGAPPPGRVVAPARAAQPPVHLSVSHPLDELAELDDLGITPAVAATAPARRASVREEKRRGPGRPRLDEEEAGSKLPLYVRRHTRRWLRGLEGDIEDKTGHILNRSRISRGILTGTERSKITLDRCANESEIAATIEEHLRAGRVLLAALRLAGVRLDQLSPREAARHFAAAASSGGLQLLSPPAAAPPPMP
jgi:hypothetical protein